MNYLIIGLNCNKGISPKNGQPYDLTFLHCASSATPYKGSGFTVREFTCSTSIVPSGLSVGDVCSIFFDELKRPVRVDPVGHIDLAGLVF